MPPSGLVSGMSPAPLDPTLAVRAAPSVQVSESVEDAYRRLSPGLVRLAFLLVDTNELAEEAVQEAFASAYPKWNRVENPDAYLRVSVINWCRKVQRRRRLVRRTTEVAVENGALGADHVADVVRALKSPMKEMVVLRYYLQLSEPEISETLNVALGTVKSSLHRARAQIKKELS
jgi:RNA polymerase sigma factor (sigma-70 family)